MLKVAFGKQMLGRTQVLLNLRVVCPLLKMMNAQIVQQWAKQMKSVDWMKELVLENRKTTIFEVANIQRISFRSVQSIWKTVQTCFELLPNLCSHSFVHAWICGQNHDDCCSLDFTLCDFTVLKLNVTVRGSGFYITMMQAKLQDATRHHKIACTSGTVDGLTDHSRWDSIS